VIKALSGDTVIFGLSRLNVEKLQEGKPIVFDGGFVGFPGKRFLILFGETEDAIVQELAVATSGGTA
jgi:hypothetical protein